MQIPLAHLAGGGLAPLQIAPALILALAYARRAQSLARAGRPVPAMRILAFEGGMALIAVTLASPLGHVSDELFSVHMAEHLLIGDIAPLLIVLGLTGPLLAPLLRIRAIDRLRLLSHPAVALPLWAGDLAAWHLPVLYQAAVHHPEIHALEHALFIACGVNMWMPLLGPLPVPRWFGNLGRLLYVIGVRLSGAIVGNVFLWSASVAYPDYAAGERFWNVSPLADQSAAGAVMMIEGSIVTILLFGWLFARAARHGEESQTLLDLARSRGVELTPARAGRAVAAGRGAELRRRVEAAGDPGER